MRWMAVALGFAACAPASSPRSEASAPLAQSTDSADHGCRVVLRSISDSLADFDVANSVGGPGALLYRADGGAWTSADGLAISGAPGWYQRYRVRLPDGASAVELVPYAALPTGARLFDHNRQSSDLANYQVSAPFQLADDGVCLEKGQPRATLEFLAGYTQAQHGALVSGGHVSVKYDLSRLAACRSTDGGARFWSLDASVKFQPSGLVSTGTVVASNGSNVSAIPFEADIPDGTQSAELWFHNYTPGSCDAWDSNFGQNYHFPVGLKSAEVGWAGDWGSSFARDCTHNPGVPEPAVIDEYVRERACTFVDADVWAPGVTDADHPEWVQAQVEWHMDSQPDSDDWLEFQGRVGNNARFRWNLPGELRQLSDWSTVSYRFRFTTDGNRWSYIEQDNGQPRTVTRAFTLP